MSPTKKAAPAKRPAKPKASPKKKAAAKAPAKKRSSRETAAQREKRIRHTLETFEKQRTAIALRAAGRTYREIGHELECDHKYAWRLVQEGMRENIAESVAEMREEDDTRLVKLLAAVWRPAMSGNTPSVMAAIRILERRAKLWGLDAPVGVDAAVTVQHEGAVLVIEADTKEGFMAGLEQASPRHLKAVT